MELLRLLIGALLLTAPGALLGCLSFKRDGVPDDGASDHRILRMVGLWLLYLLIYINASLWMPVRVLLPVIGCISLVFCILLLVRRKGRIVNFPWLPALGIFGALLAACLLYAHLFSVGHFWLVEGPNHDSIFYYEGAEWSWWYPLYMPAETVKAKWHLGGCRDGMVFIGTDCIGYRNGTYALLSALMGANRPIAANWQHVAACFGMLMPAMGVWAYVGLDKRVKVGKSSQRLVFIFLGSLLIFCCPGAFSALTGENIATLFGASAIAMLIALACANVSPQQMTLKACVLGIGAALAAHLYGEAAPLAIFVVFLGVLSDSLSEKKLKNLVTRGAMAAGCFLISANVVLIELLDSYKEINSIASGGNWPHWYMGQSWWVWLAAPFAGEVMASPPLVNMTAIYVGLLLAICLVPAMARHRIRVILVGLVLFATGMIWAINARNYAYGEHKVLQLLGVAMYTIGVLIAWEYWVTSKANANVWKGLAFTFIMGGVFCAQSAWRLERGQLRSMGSAHVIANDFEQKLRATGSGEWVLLDDFWASGISGYQKSHYVALLSKLSGNSIAAPDFSDNPLRGGYARNVIGNTWREAKGVRWLVRLNSSDGKNAAIFSGQDAVVERSSDFDLLDLRKMGVAIAPATGWGACENQRCSVSPAFSLEAYVMNGCSGQMEISVEVRNPPKDGTLLVERQDGSVETVSALQHKISVGLNEGWNRVSVRKNWFSDKGSEPVSLGGFADIYNVRGVCVKENPHG